MSISQFGDYDNILQIPASTRAYVEDELESGEKIVWLGQPVPWRMAVQTLPIMLFAIPWTAFALFWTAAAAGFQLPNLRQPMIVFPLFGVPFILIGVAMLSAPFWMWRSAARTAYVVTDRRAITFSGGRSMRIRSFQPSQLKSLSRVQRKDGSGDVIFFTEATNNSKGRSVTDIGFSAVRDVKHVESIVRALAESVSDSQKPA